MLFFIKMIVSALMIACVSEVAKRYTFMGALMISWPIISVLTIGWLYLETHDIQKIQIFSREVFWLTLPGLAFFLIFPGLLQLAVNFYVALLSSLLVTAGIY